jgi:CheY-like chemotaxis protein
VLVIDDDADVRRFLVDSLEALGYEVEAAADGLDGLAALDRAAPDLVVLDYAMPGMTGAEVAKAARARRPGLPIVFASGYSDTAAIEAVLGAGAPVLRKPFGVDQLSEAISEALHA